MKKGRLGRFSALRVLGSITMITLSVCMLIVSSVYSAGFTTSSIAATTGTTCVITKSGAVKCWGINRMGVLGVGNWKGPLKNNNTYYTDKPVTPLGLTDGVKSISGGNEHFCVVTKTGGVKCWGKNGDGEGQLGIGKFGPETCPNSMGQMGGCSTKPLDVSGLTKGVTGVASGYNFSCAVTGQGKVKCWGSNLNRVLGPNGPVVSMPGSSEVYERYSYVPVDIPNLSGVVKVVAGVEHICVLLSSGSVKCWGSNRSGQLGVGTYDGPEQSMTGACSKTPVTPQGLSTGVVDIVNGAAYSCALMSDGTVKCWGAVSIGIDCMENSVCDKTEDSYKYDQNNDQISCKKCESNSTPIEVPGISNAKSLFGSNSGNCVVTQDEKVLCWGGGFAPYFPYEITGLAGLDIKEMAIGTGHACALLSSGKVKCFGNDGENILGTGKVVNGTPPGEQFNVFDVINIP